MTDKGLEFVHKYVPAADGAEVRRPLLLLHGTGGNENQLLEVGAFIAPGAPLLSPRGKVLENGMNRYFRRIADGVFDMDDLMVRTDELASFLTDARTAYGWGEARFVAVGFSNGANIAGSLLLRHPHLFDGAVLYRPMVPFVPEALPDLSHAAALVMPGEMDSLVPPEESERLVQLLQQTGASVRAHWQPVGHGLTKDDFEEARDWLKELDEGQ